MKEKIIENIKTIIYALIIALIITMSVPIPKIFILFIYNFFKLLNRIFYTYKYRLGNNKMTDVKF